MSDLDRLVRWFEASEHASRNGRAESEQCRDYFDDRQLTQAQRNELKKRRQPIVIENLIKPKVEGLCGLERQSRTDPKCLPRNMADEEDAFAVTDALRYVATDQRLDIKRSAVFQDMMIEGTGGVEVGAARVRGGAIDPTVTKIAWNRLFWDTHSTELDFSDARYLGFVTWMDLDEALAECEPGAKWAGKQDVLTSTLSRPHSSQFSTYGDKPRYTAWADDTRRRIRINTCYYLKGRTWYRAVYTLAGELEPCAPSPWLDEDGKPTCGLILQSAYIDRDNDRYGLVRGLLSLQDEVNKRRSKYLHQVSSVAIRVSAGASQDAETIRKEAQRPDGVIIADQGEVERLGFNDLAAGHFNLLAEAKAAIERVGPNAHLQGKAGEGQSGRAILAMQQGGMTEMAPIMDSLHDFNLRVYRAIWCRIRQFWTAERWVRVTDDESTVRFVGFNVTKGHLAQQKVIAALKAGEIDQQTAQAYAQAIQADPSMLQPANMVAEMDVDIEIEEVPDSPSLQIEEFEQLVKMAAAAPGTVPPKVIIEASTLRSKQKLLKILEEHEKAQQEPNPAQLLSIQEMQAKIAELEAKAAFTGARAQSEQVRAGWEAYRLGQVA